MRKKSNSFWLGLSDVKKVLSENEIYWSTVEVTDEFVDKFGFDDADLLNKQLRDLVKLGFLYPITLSYETPRKYKFTERWMPHRFDFGDKKVIVLCDNKYEECVAG